MKDGACADVLSELNGVEKLKARCVKQQIYQEVKIKEERGKENK